MNSAILARASLVIPEKDLLVNVVRLRVRQLAAGHRALIATPPGMGLADVALSEIADNKLTSEPNAAAATLVPAAAAAVISFPAAPASKKRAA
jgi:DNA-directed RNA polymerase subunit K/omega